MSSKATELVLVFPTSLLDDLGRFQGLSEDVLRYFPRVVDPSVCYFAPRDRAEDDPTLKQVIPYVLLRHGSRVFHYTRGQRSGEARLRRLGSIGVGGHVNPIDRGLFSQDSFYDEAVRREVTEEVALDTSYDQRVIAVINDDSTAVGGVHFGIVHLFDLAEPRASARESKLVAAGFVEVTDLVRRRDDLEGWSALCLDWLIAHPE